MLGSIFGFGKSIFDGLMANRKAKAQANAEVTIAEGKAKAQAILNASQDASAWERLQAQASMTSWKDELLTVFYVVVLSTVFFANLLGHGAGVYSALDMLVKAMEVETQYGTLNIFSIGFLICVMASFGFRGIAKLIGR